MNDDIRLAPVAAYNSQLEADLVVARLQAAGIRAHVWSDGLGGAFPGMPMATGGFQVMVAEANAEAGRAVILEMGSQAANVSRGSLNARGWRWAMWLVPLAGLIFAAVGLVPRLF